jgi:hypothetical protein
MRARECRFAERECRFGEIEREPENVSLERERM